MHQPLASTEFVPDVRARFTADEFIEAISIGAFAGMRLELLDGELERMTPPMSEHGRIRLDVAVALRTLLAGDPRFVVYGEIGIRIGDRTVITADAAIARRVSGENRMLQPDEVLLAIEISNTMLARDPGARRSAHATAGMPNYWVIDVGRRLVHRFTQPTDGDYLALASMRFGEPVPVPGVDGTILLD